MKYSGILRLAIMVISSNIKQDFTYLSNYQPAVSMTKRREARQKNAAYIDSKALS
jgi:hypothetical protein